MKKFKLIIFIVIILILSGIYYYKSRNQIEKVHYHAGFQVYIDGKLQDFSAGKYMHIKACSDESHLSKEEQQLEKAHLHDSIGNVVHVHNKNVVWNDLFINLKFKFDQKKPLTGFVNGKKIDNLLDYQIKSYDSIVIFSGEVEESLLKNAVSKEQIIQAEKKTESC